MTRQALSLRAIAWLLGLAPILWPSSAAAQHLALEADGSILYVNPFNGAVTSVGLYRIDAVTGAVTPLSTDTAGSGPEFTTPRGVAVEAAGTIVVVDSSTFPVVAHRILRVDPATGARTIVSDATTGAGPALTAPYSVVVGGDGEIYVTDGDSIVRVDPASGDRAVVSSAAVGTGPSLDDPLGLAFEADGHLVTTVPGRSERIGSSILRIDPATGDRTLVSDADTGRGRRLRDTAGLRVGPKGKIAVADSPVEPSLCIPFCPHPLCLACLAPGASLVKVDPQSGNRHRVSGGGSCVYTVGGCQTPIFGGMGDGPGMLDATDLAREAADTYVMAFDDGAGAQGVMRVDPATHDRTILADLAPFIVGGNAARSRSVEVLQGLAARHPERIVHRADATEWLRQALGKAYAGRLGRTPESLFDGFSPAERRVIGRRLYDALMAPVSAR